MSNIQEMEKLIRAGEWGEYVAPFRVYCLCRDPAALLRGANWTLSSDHQTYAAAQQAAVNGDPDYFWVVIDGGM